VLKELPEFFKSLELVGGVTAEEANAAHIAAEMSPPYLAGELAYDFVAKEEITLLRAHGAANQERSWATLSEVMEGKTAKEIKNLLGIKDTPTSLSEVKIPAGTKIRMGVAGPQEAWGASGGGLQVEILDNLTKVKFILKGPIK
jgi:hypothetical protein